MILYRSAAHPKGEDVILTTHSFPFEVEHALLALGYRIVQPCAEGEDATHTCPWCEAQEYVMAATAAYYPDQAGLSAVRKNYASVIKQIQEQDLDP